MSSHPPATPASIPGQGQTPAEAPRAAKISSTRALVRGALGVGAGILAGAIVLGEGGLIHQIQNWRVDSALADKKYERDPVGGNRLSPRRYQEAMAVRKEDIVSERICGQRIKLRESAMEDLRAINACMLERIGKCAYVTSGFRTNGDQDRIKNDPRSFTPNQPGDSAHEVGMDWDMRNHEEAYIAGCICNPSEAPKTEDGKTVQRCGGWAKNRADPVHVYRDGARQHWIKGDLIRAKENAKKRWDKFRGKGDRNK